MVKNYYVYIMTNKGNTVLYTGVTNNLTRRVFEHQHKLTPGFTSRYNAVKLVYYEEYPSVYDAISREKQIKRWRREKKEWLINSINSGWKDLSDALE